MAETSEPTKDMQTPAEAPMVETALAKAEMPVFEPAEKIEAEVKPMAAEAAPAEMTAEPKAATETKKKTAPAADKAYGKSSVGKWIVIYVIAAIVIYGIIYFLFLNKTGY